MDIKLFGMGNRKEFDDDSRINALREYDILDSQPEEAYDDIAVIAAQICGATIGAISFIDGKRQWLKAQTTSVDISREIANEHSLCIHALNETGDVLVVPDCTKDERFANNILVKEGAKIKFYAAAPLVTPGGFAIGALCVLDTGEKSLDTDQVKSLKVLARQVIQLLELRKSNRLLEKRLKELEQFSYVVSHDLRGPVKNISALIKLLDIQLKSNDHKDSGIYMSKISKESDRMNNMIADLLDYSLVGKQNQKMEWINLEELVNDVKLGMEQKIRETGAEIMFKGPVSSVFAVKTDILRLLQNLLENGLKFKRNTITPTISIACTEEDPFWKISVSDNGIGLTAVDSEKIFEIFSRLHTNEQYQGTGIGLAVCKRIAENHEGKIWVESKLNLGSIFHVLLKKNY